MREARLGVDTHAAHLPEVDHDSAVAGGKAGDAVPAAANRDRQVVAARKADRRDHVGRACAAYDQRRPPVIVRAVPDLARICVSLVGCCQDLAPHGIPQFLHRRLPEHGSKRFRHVVRPFFDRVAEVLTGAPLRGLCGALASRSSCLSTAASPSVSWDAW
jgi:hypothetical protein